MLKWKIGQQRFSQPSPARGADAFSPVVVFEPLERRELLSAGLPSIISVNADNRGMVVMTADCNLNSNTVTQASVQLWTAGADGLLGTRDDVIQSRDVSYDAATRQIRINANLPANTRYRVVLDGQIIRSTDGVLLDGEFNGVNTPSGDGTPGGDFEFFTRLPVTEEIVRFTTVSGIIDIRLFRSDAPLSVANFLNYANRGVYDTTFFHRSVDNFVIQGGGFSANSNFSAIPPDPPVMNEFLRSNTRGTVAYAKMGNDPNSATSQWFFNLGNNGPNLDTQNGGFTVFAEIVNAQGLTVMDALAAFQTVNASSANSAFNEIPVVDVAAFNARGSLAVSDLVGFSRVALLMDISGEPTQQPPLEGQVNVTSNNGQVIVRLFDMNGTGLLNETQFVSVRFGSGNTISQIRLLEPPSNVRIGIQIFGANAVSSIVDLRTTSASDIAFIVSDSSVGTVRLIQRLSGENLNGFAFPGGFLMSEDIDGDGLVTDTTSLFIAEGRLSSLTARSGLSGDVVVPGGIGTVRAQGEVRNVDFVFGSAAPSTSTAAFNLASVVDSSIRTPGGLRSVSAAEWLNTGGVREVIQAATLGKLTIRGGSGIEGNFEADVNLTEGGSNFRTLGSANIRGGIFRADWTIAGHAGAITARGMITQWTLNVGGDGRNIRAQSIAAADIAFGGRFQTLRTAEWNGGRFEADTARNITITGNRSAGIAGDLRADFLIENSAQQRLPLRALQIAGSFNGSDFLMNRGDLSNLRVGGETRDVRMILENGNFSNAMFGEVYDSTVTVFGMLRSLSTERWVGGQIGAREVQNLTVTGNPSKGLSGDLFVDELRSDALGNINLLNGGSFVGDIFAVRANNIQITGDARDGTISVGGSSVGAANAITFLRIRGAMDRMDLRTANSIGTISVGSMRDSGIYVGTTTLSGLPDTNAGINPQAVLGLVRVEGFGNTDFAMFNSFIVAGRINAGLVTQPQIDNFGRPFGVAAQTIGMFGTRIGNSTTTLSNNSGSQAFGDYQVRIGFMQPA